ncbi:LuxR C-terminal-related transcriptional regulator [Pseudomonas vancouverensis]|uniref:Helix-turn-helix transcriptional regulator n=1 Tax=Pseudomonas vancouverensis TaxID=95300 RepID=A0A1H2NHR8_PSEVA|nr:LuxR C-terminal-related transcriptional regulator [Pseudomonas vancouverensis]KAB0489409.1 AAA family ATPase [Pseudomonas vancouverensis]TDB60893.1 helix-turn-helix transcriptional regulator [Pseudomonas vancouverensis]SDV04858.1 LuxR family transcriptional regulator, maltose regulon positive regulatory protein [Pseudomonas vancouverensis]
MDKYIQSNASDAHASQVFTPVQSPIVSTKLIPPRSGGRLISRERLQEQMLKARRLRCIVLKGPAGCGKTSTLIAWRQALLPLNFDVAWLTLSADDNELTRFIDYLLASLGQIDPSLVHEATQLEGRGIDSEAVERTIITLVRSIASRGRELVLVLDDLHHLTDVGIHQALQWLLDYAPPNLHLALVSRSAVPLSLARLRSQELVLELNLRDLRFTQAESEQFLKAQLGDITARDAKVMHELTDGWVAGLQLLAVSRKKNRPPVTTDASSVQAQLRDDQAFAKFFEVEVLSHLSPTDLDLLLLMAVCNRFCASLCAALSGQPQAVGEATALLARLERDNLFLIPVDSAERETWYRLHPLLRETLLKYFDSRTPAEQQAVHVRAWNWFREHNHLDEAVHHAVLGGDPSAAADLVEQHAEALYAHGDLRMLIELVRLLPVEQVQARVKLRILKARMQLYARDFAACSATLEQLSRDVPDSEVHDRFMVSILRASLALQRDDTDAAMAVLPQLLNPPPDSNSIAIGSCTNILSWLYMHRGEYEKARQVQLERPLLLINGEPLQGTTAGTLQGRCLIGLSLALEGQMTQAERVYRDVLHEANQCGKGGADATYLSAALLGEVLYETNDVDAAFKMLSGWIDILERISIPDSVLRVLQVLWNVQWLAGNHQEALAFVERLDEYATKLGLERLQAYCLTWQVRWLLILGETTKAKDKLARLEAIDARHPDAGHTALKEIHILAENARARWQLHQGDLDGALVRIEQLIETCELHRRQLGTVRLLVLSAVIEAQRGNRGAARDKVLEALRRGQRFGLLRSLLDAHPDALRLISSIASEESLDPVLAFYVERLQAADVTAPAVSRSKPKAVATSKPVTAGIEPLSEREIEVVRLLAQALPNKKIARALGLSPETVKWHLSHIYSKLGVSSRDEAVARVRDLESQSDGGSTT